MIADEVQCGMGRTGKMYAIEHYGIVPDLVVSAKSLGAGMPISAVTGRAEIMDAPHAGGVGGTYGGSPLACVAAIEAIKTIRQPEFMARASQIGTIIRETAQGWKSQYDLVGDVRGLGAMMLIELVTDRNSKAPAPDETLAIIKYATARGVILIRAGLHSNCIRFLPPLVITDEQLHEALGIIGQGIAEVSG
jgi:4-aminobutyrate aminotransferase/(S)-3-amino-2-methylpropionate transaminase